MPAQTFILFVILSLFGGAVAADASGGSPTIGAAAPVAGATTLSAPVDDASGGSPTH